jgi:hypothetical protein
MPEPLHMNNLVTRREAMIHVTTLLGGFALVGGDRLLADSASADLRSALTRSGVGEFTPTDILFLDEVAETILPETKTPGAKAARTGAFMALMVTDAYAEPDQQIFRDGMRTLDDACRRAHGASFVDATPAQRLTLLEQLDREQKAFMDQRAGASRSRAPAPPVATGPVHYFRMMKELALLGYFTSEIGYTQAMRYVEAPGRFDPCAPHAPGDKAWAPHA